MSEVLDYGSCVTRGWHSLFACHPNSNHSCLYSPSAVTALWLVLVSVYPVYRWSACDWQAILIISCYCCR